MAEPEILKLQAAPEAPIPAGFSTGTDLILPPTWSPERLAHFPESVYDLAPESHLVRFTKVLLGEAGAGQLKRRLLLSRLQQTIYGSHFFDLDRFYGALFGVRRRREELLTFDPYTDLATADEWMQEHAKDASYRSRIEQFARAIHRGATPIGMEMVAEALLNVDSEVYESFTLADTSFQTWAELEVQGTFAAFENRRFRALEGYNSGQAPISPNLLSAQDASLEGTGTGAWVAGASTTIARSTVRAAHGVASLRLTRTGTIGEAQATIDFTVRSATVYTARAEFIANSTGRQVTLALEWYDQNGALISGNNSGTYPNDSTANWTIAKNVGAVSPTGAVKGRLRLRVYDCAVDEIHDVDKIGIQEGYSSSWSTQLINRREFTIRPKREISLEEAHDLERVIARLKPLDALARVDHRGVVLHEPIALRGVFADSQQWEVLQQEVPVERAPRPDEPDFIPGKPVIRPQPPFCGYQGEVWSCNKDISGLVVYKLNLKIKQVVSIATQQVVTRTGMRLDFLPEFAILPRLGPLVGRYASDAILTSRPYSQPRVSAATLRDETGAPWLPGVPAFVGTSQILIDRRPVGAWIEAIQRAEISGGGSKIKASQSISVKNSGSGSTKVEASQKISIKNNAVNISQRVSIKSRFWCTPPREQEDDSRECMEIRLTHRCRINHISFDRSHFPHTTLLEFYNEETGEWEEETSIDTRLPVRFSVPFALPPDFNDVEEHPHHPEGEHWSHCTWNFRARDVTRFRIVLWRSDGDAPVSNKVSRTITRIATAPAPMGYVAIYSYFSLNVKYTVYKVSAKFKVKYSLALRNIDVGYRCKKRKDLPVIVRDPKITPVGTSEDILGTRIEYVLRETKASNLLALPPAPWLSEPQPISDAVVNLYADTRDSEGQGQTIDRFYLDPTHPGAALNLYWSNDDPDADFDASDDLLPARAIKAHGTLTPAEEGLAFATGDHPSIEIDNTVVQFDPGKPWWAGMEVRTGFASSTVRRVMLDLEVLSVELAGGALWAIRAGSVYDTFTRPDAAALRTADSGERWTEIEGPWSITFGQAHSDGGAARRAVVDGGSGNLKLRARYVNPSNAGIIFRVRDENNYLYVAVIPAFAALGLYRVDNGVTTTLKTVITGAGAEMVVDCAGPDIRVAIDGIQALFYTLSEADQLKFGTATHHGLYSNTDSTVRFEEFSAGEVVRLPVDFPGPAPGETYRSSVAFIAAWNGTEMALHFAHRGVVTSRAEPWTPFGAPIPADLLIGAGPGGVSAAVVGPNEEIFVEDWAASDGSNWPDKEWQESDEGVGVVDVQGNRGHMAVTVGNYGIVGANPHRKRKGPPRKRKRYFNEFFDGELTVTLQRPTATEYAARIWLRATELQFSKTDPPPRHGYALSIENGSVTLIRRRRDVETVLASAVPTTAGTVKIRFQVKRNRIRARVWDAGVTEPTTWTLDVTDDQLAETGKLILTLRGGLEVAAVDAYWDDLHIYEDFSSVTNIHSPSTVLRSLIVKADDLDAEARSGFFADSGNYVRKPEILGDQTNLTTDNAILRFHPSFITNDAPYGLVGGPGDFFEDVLWNPISRDYTLSKGYIHFPPIRAKYFKFEFTNLVAEPYEVFVPVTRVVKSFPAEIIEETKDDRRSDSDKPGPPGIRPAINLGDFSRYVDAFTSGIRGRVDEFRDDVRARTDTLAEDIARAVRSDPLRRGELTLRANLHSPTEGLHADLQALSRDFRRDISRWADRLRDRSWSWRFKPRNLGKKCPKWPRKVKHKYKIIEIDHTDKVGFFVGLREIRAYRVSYRNDDDTTRYVDNFEDSANIVPGYTWALDPNKMFSGDDDSVEAMSEIFPSQHDVRAIQFASQQSQATQIVYDDDFRDPALVGYDFENPDLWHRVGDALFAYDAAANSVTMSRQAQSGGANAVVIAGSEGLVQPLPHPAFSLRQEVVRSHTVGGISSGAYPQPSKGHLHIAVRLTLRTSLTSPLRLQLVRHTDDLVLADKVITAAEGEIVEAFTSYPVGSLAPTTDLVRVRLVQFDAANDIWELDTLSIFDDGITWEFSVNGGQEWVTLSPGVRNNPNGVLSFPLPGNQLRWRLTGTRRGMHVSSMQIRPIYQGLLASRPAGLLRGPNISVYDQDPEVGEDPQFRVWNKPIPYWWFSVSRRYALLPIEGAPIVTQFSRFYGRSGEETLGVADTATRIHTHVRRAADALAPTTDAGERKVTAFRTSPEGLAVADEGVASIVPPRAELVDEPVHPV